MDQGTLGNLLLVLASVAAVGSIVSIATGAKDGANARKLGSILTFAVLAFTSLATLLLAVAFLTENWALQYVIYNHPTITGGSAWLYRLSGVWAGREGSLLFWEWVLAIFAAFVAGKRDPDSLAAEALRRIRALYDIEDEVRGQRDVNAPGSRVGAEVVGVGGRQSGARSGRERNGEAPRERGEPVGSCERPAAFDRRHGRAPGEGDVHRLSRSEVSGK